MSQSRPPILCRRWRPEAAKRLLEWNPKGAAFVVLVRPLELSPKAAGYCIRRHARRVEAAGMEPKRSCIRRLGEAAGIALSPKTTL
jgi:hypothetical protein